MSSEYRMPKSERAIDADLRKERVQKHIDDIERQIVATKRVGRTYIAAPCECTVFHEVMSVFSTAGYDCKEGRRTNDGKQNIIITFKSPCA